MISPPHTEPGSTARRVLAPLDTNRSIRTGGSPNGTFDAILTQLQATPTLRGHSGPERVGGLHDRACTGAARPQPASTPPVWIRRLSAPPGARSNARTGLMQVWNLQLTASARPALAYP